MIGQYFSQTNENATVSVLQNILELNKALIKSTQEKPHSSSQVSPRVYRRQAGEAS